LFGLFKKSLPVTSMPWPPWFGPVSEAPAAVRAVLDRTPSWQTLAHRGWSAEKTLVYAPEPDVKSIAQPFVLARCFAWDDQSPVHWLLATCGLSLVTQQPAKASFQHIELALLLNNVEKDDPVPSRLGVALAKPLPGWSWPEVEVCAAHAVAGRHLAQPRHLHRIRRGLWPA
jgi:hypothetical protein